MKRQASLFLCCCILSGLTACNLPIRSHPGAGDQGVALQYQTVSALLTATAQYTNTSQVFPAQPTTQRRTPSPQEPGILTPKQTEEVVLVISPTQVLVEATAKPDSAARCDLAHPGKPIDITVPDDTRLHPGETFSKTWRLVNGGNCAWDQTYSVVWFSGDDLGLSRTQSFNGEVTPGMPVDVTIDMIAPEAPGTYQSNWKLRNSQGEMFGIGPNGDAPFWVRIVVVPLETATATAAATATMPPPTLTPTPGIGAEGSLVLKLEEALDLDSGLLNQANEDDLRFQLAEDETPVLAPDGGALLAPFGVGRPGINDCLLAPLSTEQIRLDQFQPGMYFCYRTTRGSPGWFLLSSFEMDQEEAGLEFLTWSMP